MKLAPLSKAALGLSLSAGLLAASLGTAAPRASAQTATGSTAGKPPLISNAKKYMNTGEQPATGRSGAARMSARAMMNKPDGAGAQTTDVEVTTLDGFDTGAAAPGNLDKVQLKPLDQAGEALFAKNFTGLKAGGNFNTSLQGLARGQQVQVQGNISGIDPKRVGVVTVVADTVLRPDLAASSLAAPAQSIVNSPVNITAVVSEVNGDMGAKADAVLYVGGAEVDRATGIFVNEGGTVSVAFTHTFAEEGTKSLEVRVEGVAPGDYDAANNSKAGSVEVVSPGRRMNFWAYANDHTYTHSYKQDYKRWNSQNALIYDYVGEGSGSGRRQHSVMASYMPKAMAFPLNIKAVHSSGGSEVLRYDIVAQTPHETQTWDDGYNAVTWSRVAVWENNQYAFLDTSKNTVKATNEVFEWTHAQSWRYAGDVTYFSKGHECSWWYSSTTRTCSGDPQAGNYYVWNYGGTTQWNTLVPYSDTFTITHEVSSGGEVYKAAAEMNMQPYAYEHDYPYQCYNWTGWWGDSTRGTDCWGDDYSETGKSGYAADSSN